MQAQFPQPVFRFAPSPNGFLHLGHAYSALLNQRLARESGGRMLLRIEDIDTTRCTSELIAATLEDLDWIGFRWEGPVVYQSQRFGIYRSILDQLETDGLVYPCFCSRGDIRRVAGESGAARCDPDGTPLYPGTCRALAPDVRMTRRRQEAFALRLDLSAALARTGPIGGWDESGEGVIRADPRLWGDVVLARKDTPTSYHLSVVIDDAMQGITDVVRGRDLFCATSVHRLLQRLLGYAPPRYHHHRLLTDDGGEKLAKSRFSLPLRALRADGVTPADIRAMLGLD